MRIQRHWLLPLIPPVSLVVALVFSQYGWRRERAAFDELSGRMQRLALQQSFPSDGDDLAASPLRVIRDADTLAIEQLVRGREAVIYFSRSNCAPCKWFAGQMDSVFPRWRDSLVVVTPYGHAGIDEHAIVLDSTSSAVLPGVPTVLLVDNAGYVRQFALGLPRVVRILNEAGVPSPRVSLLQTYRDSLRAAPQQ